MKHLILGDGNLGKSLSRILDNSRIIGSNLFTYPKDGIPELGWEFQGAEYIWCAIGAGSVAQAKKDFIPFVDAHVRLPVDIVQSLSPDQKAIFFSTDYVASDDYPRSPELHGEPKSLYAHSKKWMEDYLKMVNNKNVKCIRIGSLFGPHAPGFPERLKSAWKTTETGAMIKGIDVNTKFITLPMNLVSPTDTNWLAYVLSVELDAIFETKGVIQHCSPSTNCTVAQWGRHILGDSVNVIDGPIDNERPAKSLLGISWPSMFLNHKWDSKYDG